MMTVPKLLHVFPTFAMGGQQRRFCQIANGLAGKYHHLILSLDGNTEAVALLESGASFELLQQPEKIRNPFAAAKAYRRYLANVSFDRLITYNWGAIEWALANRKLRKPHIHIEDGFGPEEASGQLKRRVLFRRWALRSADALVVPSKTLQQAAESQWRVRGPETLYVPNGVDSNRFQPGSRSEGDQCVTIGTVAALRKEKNLIRLINAFSFVHKVHPDTRLVIVGGGDELAELQRRAKELKLESVVSFPGPTDRPEQDLSDFDIFALSSDTEQSPISLLEAMACGLPIASVDVGDIALMVAEENKALIAETNETALSRALQVLVEDPKRRNELGVANRAKVEAEFSLDVMLGAYDKLFRIESNP